ncbi:MFS transporter [Sphingomonas sp. LR61]|uniref:MFS transporter n=1 Tax=Sphingomonas sp. LR61 TaxID=3050234 RepID=UPI002FE11A41
MAVRIGARSTTGWKATVSVAMSNYIESGSIIAIATSLSLWQAQFHVGDLEVGLLASLSANAFGAAAGAIIGGPLCDRYGRKFIYTYDLLLYMLGILLAVFAGSYGMLLVGFILTGIAVGAGVPASWTYIAEQAPADKRAAHVGTAQLAWSIGPMVGFALAIAAAPSDCSAAGSSSRTCSSSPPSSGGFAAGCRSRRSGRTSAPRPAPRTSSTGSPSCSAGAGT